MLLFLHYFISWNFHEIIDLESLNYLQMTSHNYNTIKTRLFQMKIVHLKHPNLSITSRVSCYYVLII